MAAVFEGGVSLERHVSRVLTAVAVTARAIALLCAVVSLGVGLQAGYFVHVPLAVAGYAAVGVWSAVYLGRARSGPPALWVSVVDVTVVAGSLIALRFAGNAAYFDGVSNSALEPFVSAALVGVAVHASRQQTAAACAVLGTAYMGAVLSEVTVTDVLNAVGDVSWQIGIAVVCLMGATRLHRAALAVDEAAGQVVAEHERLAEHRGRDLERRRQHHAQRRRWLELHDGPLALLTAMSRPAPVGHPDPDVRARCSANADLLRGLLGGEEERADGLTPDLRLALVGAGADCAALGLRVRYQFGPLPADLPGPVTEALRGATRAALNNVMAHAGTGTAWVTAEAGREAPRAVTVDIVDRGRGFDPATVAARIGLPTAITDRMAAAGGAAEVDSLPGRGTWIRLRWPA